MGYTRIGSVGSSTWRPRHVARMLGDDAPTPTTEGEMSEAEWKSQMLATQRDVRDWQKRWVLTDERQRWIQIAATLSIPLAAAIWRFLLGRRRAAASGVGE